MSLRVGINGFGRIGRNVLRASLLRGNKNIVAINAPGDSKTLAHLFKYDSCYGVYQGDVQFDEKSITIDGQRIAITREREPENIPWNESNVNLVVESTGKFRDESAKKHLGNGVEKIIITAPAKAEDVTIVMGVNEEDYDYNNHNIISNASCTTNCLAPVAMIIDKHFGIKKGMMTTIHASTNDQHILDKRHSDLRRARAAGESIIPTSTGASKAVGKVLPSLQGKLDGVSMRVPIPTVSVVDVVFELEKDCTVEEVNKLFSDYANTSLKGILEYTDQPLVSVDFKMNPNSAIVDGLSTMLLKGNLLKVIAWYDNEWGYSNRVIDLYEYATKKNN